MKEYKVKVFEDKTVWYNLEGQLHREDGPAREYADGTKKWYRNGQLHREDGPAIERSNGDKYWYRDGQFHREDGPALEYASGTKVWYIEGNQLTESEFNSRNKSELTMGQIAEKFNIPVESLKIKK